MRQMSTAAFITCAITGSGDSVPLSEKVPVLPRDIAASAVAAAEAGAAAVHIHVRDIVTGQGNRDRDCFREVVERIRDSGVDVIINLTAGMGGTMVLGSVEEPLPVDAAETDMAGATERLAHVAELRPEVCTLDIQTMNFGAGGDFISVNTPAMLRAMAALIKEYGVTPEVEIFDTGDTVLLKEMIAEGLISESPLVQLCMGIPYGAPNDMLTFQALVNRLPERATFSAFSIGRYQLPYVAMSVLAGGNVRVGLEDNLYLSKGQLATNPELVVRATTILDAMNVRIKTAAEVRDELGLVKQY